MSLDAYLRYMLSEVNVDSAVARGACTAGQARDWCRATLTAVFADGEVTVVIPGYVATLGPLIQLSRSATAAMAGSMARSRTLPKPSTSAGGAAVPGSPR